MTKEQASFLMKAMEYSETDCELHEEYSGRAMFGGTTYAVSMGDYGSLISAITTFVRENIEVLNKTDIPEFGFIKKDNLGRDCIIY